MGFFPSLIRRFLSRRLAVEERVVRREGVEDLPQLEPSDWILRLHLGDSYAKAEDAPEMRLGQSRIGGPLIDVHEGYDPPDDMLFIAQLDLGWLGPLDESGLLPREGSLFFFYSHREDRARVDYYPGPSSELRRVVRKARFDDGFEEGITVVDCTIEEETRQEYLEAGERDSCAGMEKTKIGGCPCNPQWDEEEAVASLRSGKRMLLLQVGEDFTGEGTLCFFIDKEDLIRRSFKECKAVWGQT